MIPTFIAFALAVYISTLALALILWAVHTLVWFQMHVPWLTEEEANIRLRADRMNSGLRHCFFGLLLPLIWIVAAQQQANELIRWWHVATILKQQK